MAEVHRSVTFMEIIDVIWPSGTVGPVLRVIHNGKVRVFTGLNEIDSVGMFHSLEKTPPALHEVFEDNG